MAPTLRSESEGCVVVDEDVPGSVVGQERDVEDPHSKVGEWRLIGGGQDPLWSTM